MKILKINKCKILFENGEEIALTFDTIYEEKLDEGMEVSFLKYEELKEKAAYFRGISHLARYDKSEKGLALKLGEKFGKRAAEAAVKKIKEQGYIDDNEYALSFLRGKSYSRKQAVYELMKKGISSEKAKQALKESEIDEKESIKKQLSRMGDREEKKKIEALMRKGFEYSTVKECLKELKEEGE